MYRDTNTKADSRARRAERSIPVAELSTLAEEGGWERRRQEQYLRLSKKLQSLAWPDIMDKVARDGLGLGGVTNGKRVERVDDGSSATQPMDEAAGPAKSSPDTVEIKSLNSKRPLHTVPLTHTVDAIRCKVEKTPKVCAIMAKPARTNPTNKPVADPEIGGTVEPKVVVKVMKAQEPTTRSAHLQNAVVIPEREALSPDSEVTQLTIRLGRTGINAKLAEPTASVSPRQGLPAASSSRQEPQQSRTNSEVVSSGAFDERKALDPPQPLARPPREKITGQASVQESSRDQSVQQTLPTPDQHNPTAMQPATNTPPDAVRDVSMALPQQPEQTSELPSFDAWEEFGAFFQRALEAKKYRKYRKRRKA
ncbi:hypothetical protein BDW74DRAFT_172869 [Aspergillus multicolor]|uniref:uncharacterized protein n=1 Tax=Aspergillus multicolor TaxID=41759 RepID=UPI003CCD33C8